MSKAVGPKHVCMCVCVGEGSSFSFIGVDYSFLLCFVRGVRARAEVPDGSAGLKRSRAEHLQPHSKPHKHQPPQTLNPITQDTEWVVVKIMIPFGVP